MGKREENKIAKSQASVRDMVDAVTAGDLSAAGDAFEALVSAKRDHEWVRKNVLKQTQQDIDEIDKQIAAEKEEEIIDPEAGTNMGGPDGGFGALPDADWQQQNPQGGIPDADEPRPGTPRPPKAPQNQNI